LGIFISACSHFSSEVATDSHFAINEFEMRTEVLENIETISASGYLTVTSGEDNSTLHINIQFITIDTLVALVKDPLYRKLVRFEIKGNEYWLWFLREGRAISGYEFAGELSDYPIAALELNELKRAFLGLPLSKENKLKGISKEKTVEVLNYKGDKIVYTFDENLSLIKEILILTDTNSKMVKIKYSKYEKVNGIPIPKILSMEDNSKNTLIKIQLSDIKINFFI
jgi:hypothetical protein